LTLWYPFLLGFNMLLNFFDVPSLDESKFACTNSLKVRCHSPTL
jgi:hypothetical protein